jgi:putative membrane protein
MVRKIHRLQSCALLAVATLCMALAGCGSDEPSVGGPSKPDRPMETLSAGQIVTVVATINQGEMQQAEAILLRIEDEEVRAFAEKLLLDHRTEDAKLTRLAGTLGITEESSDLQSDVDELAQRMNRVLEKEQSKERLAPLFLDVQLLMHRNAMKTVDRLLLQAKQAELRTYLENLRTSLMQHQLHAAKLRKQFPDPESSR